jgi:hypothetical protein
MKAERKVKREWYVHIEFYDKKRIRIFIRHFYQRRKAEERLRDELAKIDPSELIIRAVVEEYYYAK